MPSTRIRPVCRPRGARRTVAALAVLGTVVATGCSAGEAAEGPDTDAAPSSTAEAREYDFSAVAPIIEAFIAQHGLNGAGLVVVEEDEGIIDEQYFGEFGADRSSLVASASKMVTAGVLVRLADQGLLDLDEPIADYVDWAEGHNPEITVAQLLSSSSGLVGLGPNPAYGPYVCQFLPSAEMEECAAAAWKTPGDDADIVPPDTQFRYGGVQWQIAGAVAETVSGKSWSELLEETYVEPCGVGSLGYSNHWTALGGGGFRYPADFDGDVSLLPETENPHMEGGLHIEPGDYAELLLMHLRGGRCGDAQVLEPESVELMHADRIGEAYSGAAMPGSGYGLGWWVPRDGSGRINDPGAYGAVPWLDLDGGFGAYLVLEADAGLGVSLAGQLYEPVEAAVTAAR
ncbi:serine hydrolase domain-containing protein [Blastococcus sp. SYSU D01042]